ncbi:hypothetical protein JTE90_000616 [Oedothorax gibbosus]|uniref:Uncharacterized protein n=1 Tax=Oedothorax gibbosus TaxID=931172 RepID=A0AAV6VWP2_9ARAC|nr:hypothetical protein JTE90_000616 [Oedothorax gibbosus]
MGQYNFLPWSREIAPVSPIPIIPCRQSHLKISPPHPLTSGHFGLCLTEGGRMFDGEGCYTSGLEYGWECGLVEELCGIGLTSEGIGRFEDKYT